LRPIRIRSPADDVLATDGSKNQFLLPNLTRPWNVPAAGDPETLLGEHRGVDLVRHPLRVLAERRRFAGGATSSGWI
jgi:hypothetical protein